MEGGEFKETTAAADEGEISSAGGDDTGERLEMKVAALSVSSFTGSLAETSSPEKLLG